MVETPVPELILASTSKYRANLLSRLGLKFQSIASDVDEQAAKSKFTNGASLAMHLAIAKALSVAEHHPDAVVIGGDQTGLCNGQLLEKPGNFENAKAQLQFMSASETFLLTATAIVARGQLCWTDLNVSRLKMKPLTNEQISRYLTFDEPYDCAGSFKLEAMGIALFEAIDTSDPTAIEGLALINLARQLKQLGYEIP